ncbi:MAG: hypothetical protein WC455_05945 [Dehalococcoidia bacterium]
MSKLLEKLEHISKGNSKPLGFAAAAAKSKPVNMVIIAAVDDNDKAAVTAAKEYADAILVNSIAVKNIASKSGLPWGAPISELAAIKESGCDFILLNTDDSPIALLQEEKLCRIIEIDPAMPDGLIRATNQLPVDIALISGDTSISMKRLIACQHIANMIGKYLIVRIPLEISGDELREIWEIGMTGVVVPVTGDAKKGLAALRQAVDDLPASRRKRSSKTNVSIPQIAPAAPVADEEPDEEDE